MIKAIFTDIDGTLRSLTTGRVPKSAIAALAQAKAAGVKLYIATGRELSGVYPTGVTDSIDFDGFMTLNGQLIFDARERVIYRHPIDPGDVATLVDFALHTDITVGFFGEDYRIFNHLSEGIRFGFRQVGLTPPPEGDVTLALSRPVYHISVYLFEETQNEMPPLKSSKPLRWSKYFTDIAPKTGGKDAGMRVICDGLGIAMSECMALGDGGNDADMIRAAGVGIAMGNGDELSRAAADYVTATCDDDGFALALSRYGVI